MYWTNLVVASLLLTWLTLPPTFDNPIIGSRVGSLSTEPNGVWELDKLHSQILFKVGHMGIAEVMGKFEDYHVELRPKKQDLTDFDLNIDIQTQSVNTGVEMRDQHLRSADFLNVEAHPKMNFKSSGFKKKKNNLYELKGELSLKGISKPVSLEVRMGKPVTDLEDNTRVGFVAKTTLDRRDFDVKFNKKMDNDAWLIDNEVEISISVEFILRKAS